jgi:hypothetical protein
VDISILFFAPKRRQLVQPKTAVSHYFGPRMAHNWLLAFLSAACVLVMTENI